MNKNIKPKSEFRIIFMGTPDFAVGSLKMLLDNQFQLVAVVTSPDKPAGRGQQISQSPVKEFATTHNLRVLQPTNLKDESFLHELENLKADLQVIVAFRMLPEKVWNMPKLGSINLHGSLLPHYRGAAPINWAVINGEKKTGVTTFFLKHEIDTGDILFQEELPINENANAGEIHDQLIVIGSKLILKTLEAIIENKYIEIPQNQLQQGEKLKIAPKIFKEDCRIDWGQSVKHIHDFIRGLSPHPTAWSEFRDEQQKVYSFKLFKAHYEENRHQLTIGTLVSDGKNYLKVACTDGFIGFEELQVAGKRRLGIREFLIGIRHVDQLKIIN